ncbi:hypothetical protein NKG94_16460 [Micromonospora sp. M12]
MLARGHGFSFTRGYLAERVRPGWAFAGWLVAAWQVSLGFGVGLGFVYVLAALCLITLTAWLIHRPRLSRRLIVGDLIGGLVFTAVTGYFAYAYQHVRELNPNVTRDWDYVAHFSPTLRGLLVAPQSSLPWGTLHNDARTALGGVPTERCCYAGMHYIYWPSPACSYPAGRRCNGFCCCLGWSSECCSRWARTGRSTACSIFTCPGSMDPVHQAG